MSPIYVDMLVCDMSFACLAGLLGLVDDLQASLELAKRIVENTEMSNPIKVTYAVKQLAKEAATGTHRHLYNYVRPLD